VNLIPVGIIIHPDITELVFHPAFLLDRDGQGNYPVGPHDQAAVPVSLFGIVIMLLNYNLTLLHQAGIIVYGSVI
jgi:hypothetical protein